ncbi:hypothetical protein [Tabrizicola sp.]|uniref:hypothetical protein n=1 Tax=Tabrizicola sp. TaxID=2005166 RepID=UPI003F3DB5A5
MTADPNDEDTAMDILMAEVHIARQLSQAQPAVVRGVTPADLWAEVRRAAGDPASLAVARALRGDPAMASRYRQMLSAVALAASPVALAASDGEVDRRIGSARLRLLPVTDGDVPLVVLEGAAEAASLEMVGHTGESLRLALPEPDAGTVILSLGPDFPQADAALALLRDPGTALYLLP